MTDKGGVVLGVALASALASGTAWGQPTLDPPPAQEPNVLVEPAPAPPAPVEGRPAPPSYEPTEVRPAPPPYERTVPPYEWQPNPIARRTAIGLETHVWSAKSSGTGMPMVMFFSGALGDSVSFDMRLPLAFVFGAGAGDRSAAAIGNPTVTVLYAPTSGGFTWFFGGRLAAPLASASSSGEFAAALLYAAYATTSYDLHLWIPNHIPVGLRLGFEYQSHANLFLRASFDPTVHLPFGRASGREATFVHQMRAEIEGRSDAGFGAGLGLQYVHVATETNARNDSVQTAMEPYFVYESRKAFFMRAGWLVALDEPLGFGFDQGKVASFRLTLGSQL